MANQTENTKLTKQDIKKVYIRNLFALQFGWNYEKMQGLGYAYVIMPVLKRLYKNDPEKMKKALKMQLSYFNTLPPWPISLPARIWLWRKSWACR